MPPAYTVYRLQVNLTLARSLTLTLTLTPTPTHYPKLFSLP